MVENLPPNNAVTRELFGMWGDDLLLAHDTNSRIRDLVIQNYNIHRGKDERLIEPEYLPKPGNTEDAVPQVSPEVIQAERDHLQAVLNRPNPQ